MKLSAAIFLFSFVLSLPAFSASKKGEVVIIPHEHAAYFSDLFPGIERVPFTFNALAKAADRQKSMIINPLNFNQELTKRSLPQTIEERHRGKIVNAVRDLRPERNIEIFGVIDLFRIPGGVISLYMALNLDTNRFIFYSNTPKGYYETAHQYVYSGRNKIKFSTERMRVKDPTHDGGNENEAYVVNDVLIMDVNDVAIYVPPSAEKNAQKDHDEDAEEFSKYLKLKPGLNRLSLKIAMGIATPVRFETDSGNPTQSKALNVKPMTDNSFMFPQAQILDFSFGKAKKAKSFDRAANLNPDELPELSSHHVGAFGPLSTELFTVEMTDNSAEFAGNAQQISDELNLLLKSTTQEFEGLVDSSSGYMYDFSNGVEAPVRIRETEYLQKCPELLKPRRS